MKHDTEDDQKHRYNHAKTQIQRELWRWSVGFGLVVCVLTVIALVVPDTVKPKEFAEFLNQFSTLMQGTIGVAATIASAIVTVYLAFVAIRLAEATTLVSQRDQQRENERYAREIKTEIVSFMRSMEKLHLLLNSKVPDVNQITDMFAARLIAREALGQSNKAALLVFEERGRNPLVDINASWVVLEDAIKKCVHFSNDDQTHIQIDWEIDYLKELSHKVKSTRKMAPGMFPHGFFACILMPEELTRFRACVQDIVNCLDATLEDLEAKSCVFDMICAHKDASRALGLLRQQYAEVKGVIEDNEALIERLAMTKMVANAILRAASTREAVPDGLAFWMTFFGLPAHAEGERRYAFEEGLQVPEWFATMLKTMQVEAAALTSFFNLGQHDDTHAIPRSFSTFKTPFAYAKFCSGLENLTEDTRAFQDSAYLLGTKRVEVKGDLLFWHNQCASRLYGDAKIARETDFAEEYPESVFNDPNAMIFRPDSIRQRMQHLFREDT